MCGRGEGTSVPYADSAQALGEQLGSTATSMLHARTLFQTNLMCGDAREVRAHAGGRPTESRVAGRLHGVGCFAQCGIGSGGAEGTVWVVVACVVWGAGEGGPPWSA